MADAPTDITLGEVWRGLVELRTALTNLAASLTGLRADLEKEVESQVTTRLQAQSDRIGRLEKVVYGAVGIILAGVLTAVLALVVNKPS